MNNEILPGGYINIGMLDHNRRTQAELEAINSIPEKWEQAKNNGGAVDERRMLFVYANADFPPNLKYFKLDPDIKVYPVCRTKFLKINCFMWFGEPSFYWGFTASQRQHLQEILEKRAQDEITAVQMQLYGQRDQPPVDNIPASDVS